MPTIGEAAEKLSERQERGEKLEEKFDEFDSIETDSVVKESFLSKKIEQKKPGTVAGVDGGIARKRYSSADVVAVRAIAAVFDFRSGELESTYIPGKTVEPEFHVFDSVDQEGMERRSEVERLKEETGVAMEAAGKADKVLMDGSIVPSYSEDEEVIEGYEELYEKAGEGNLVGVVEDSYGLKMTRMLEKKLDLEIGNLRDTLLMDAILGEGERSFVRRYSKGPVEHPVLQEMDDDCVRNLYTFYLKLSSRDIPLRIDYYGEVEDADEIASVLDFLKTSSSYTAPSPIVEADKRAKMEEKYLKRLEKRFSPEMRRRERRSF